VVCLGQDDRNNHTRETFRRQTMHQFMDAGLAIPNPDNPNRPINSPKWCYQIVPNALAPIQSFGTSDWGTNLAEYVAKVGTLHEQYARARQMNLATISWETEVWVAASPTHLINFDGERF
jgi:adenine-specific DNA-methyltransferase